MRFTCQHDIEMSLICAHVEVLHKDALSQYQFDFARIGSNS